MYVGDLWRVCVRARVSHLHNSHALVILFLSMAFITTCDPILALSLHVQCMLCVLYVLVCVRLFIFVPLNKSKRECKEFIAHICSTSSPPCPESLRAQKTVYTCTIHIHTCGVRFGFCVCFFYLLVIPHSMTFRFVSFFLKYNLRIRMKRENWTKWKKLLEKSILFVQPAARLFNFKYVQRF